MTIFFKSKILTGIIIVIILIGCKSNDREPDDSSDFTTISINPQQQSKINLSEFVESINVIPLQTTDSSLIQEILGIKKFDEKYYVQVPGKILGFNENGTMKGISEQLEGGLTRYWLLQVFTLTVSVKPLKYTTV